MSPYPTPRIVLGTISLDVMGSTIFTGGHGTGKTGNLVINFSRQGKHREFGQGTENE